MGHCMGKTTRLINQIGAVVLDFDETITTKDTIQFLAKKAYERKPGFNPPFSHYVNIYMERLKPYMGTNDYLNNVPQKKISLNTLVEKETWFQKNLKDVELSSVSEIGRTGLFKSLSKDDFKAVAKNVEVRPRLKEFLALCIYAKVPVFILSVNWSSTLISEVLSSQCGCSLNIDDVYVYANEFEFDSKGICTGKVAFNNNNIRTGYDKVLFLEKLLAKHGVNKDKKTLYVGDSRSDFLAALQCDLSIFVDKGPSIRMFLENVAQQLHDFSILLLLNVQQGEEKILYLVKDFREIVLLLEM